MKNNSCSNILEHTPAPTDYLSWHSWACGMYQKGYRQRKCPGCQLYKIWEAVKNKMTYIEQAIKEAVEKGGYVGVENATSLEWQKVVLDPSFWQALGKAQTWKKSRVPFYTDDIYSDQGWHDIPRWQYEWHRFIDHLAEGKDAESFFKEVMGQV